MIFKINVKDIKNTSPIFLSLDTMEFVIPDSVKKEYYFTQNRYNFNSFFNSHKDKLVINDSSLKIYLQNNYPEVLI
jgi:hypothetical protein